MDPRELARQQREIRNQRKLRELDRSSGDLNLAGNSLSASGVGFGSSGGLGAPSGDLLYDPTPSEVVAVTADTIGDGGLVEFTQVVTPPARVGFAGLSLPATDIPVSYDGSYHAVVEAEWVGTGDGGTIEVLVGGSRVRALEGRQINAAVHFGAIRAGVGIQVRARPHGAPQQVRVRLVVQMGNLSYLGPEFAVDEVEALPPPPATPTAPTLTAGAELTNAWIEVTWAPVVGAVAYEVRVVRVADGSTTLAYVEAAAVTKVEWLDPLTEYSVSVWAIDEYARRSEISPATLITTPGDTTIPDAPIDVSITAGFTTVTVQWKENKEADVKFGEGGYDVQLATNNLFTLGLQTKSTAGTIASFADLAFGTTYYARVRAKDKSQNLSQWSAIVFVNTPNEIITEIDPLSITEGMLATGAVVSRVLGANVVDGTKLADGSVDVTKMVDNAITAAKLADGAVIADKIAANAVTATAIAANSIIASKIAVDAIDATKIQANAITAIKIDANAVTADKVAANAISAANIQAGVITSDKIVTAGLDAAVIKFGVMSGDRITANTLDVNSLKTSTLTSRTITIGTGGNLQVQGSLSARLLIDANGLRLFNSSGTNTVALWASGSASFSGSISASTISIGNFYVNTAGYMQATDAYVRGNVQASSVQSSISMTSPTITGGTLQTASSGTRVVISSSNVGAITFWNSSNWESTTLKQGNSDGAEFSGSLRVGGSLGNRTLYVGNISSAYWSISSGGTVTSNRLEVGGSSGSPTDVSSRVVVDGSGYVLANRNGASGYFGRTTSGDVMDFRRYGTQIGRIYVSTTTCSYISNSDYRLKQNFRPIPNSLARLNQLKPILFNWKDEPDEESEGFLAHEVADIVPQAVQGGKDAVTAEGVPIYQGIDNRHLVPLVVAALQELSARVVALENQ